MKLGPMPHRFRLPCWDTSGRDIEGPASHHGWVTSYSPLRFSKVQMPHLAATQAPQSMRHPQTHWPGPWTGYPTSWGAWSRRGFLQSVCWRLGPAFPAFPASQPPLPSPHWRSRVGVGQLSGKAGAPGVPGGTDKLPRVPASTHSKFFKCFLPSAG